MFKGAKRNKYHRKREASARSKEREKAFYEETEETFRATYRHTRAERENNLEQDDLKNSIRMLGLSPDTEEENDEETLEVVIDFFNQQLEFPLTVADIENAQRFGTFRLEKTRPVVVRLVEFHTKVTIMKKKKELRRLNTGVIIYEELTKLSNDVLSSVRLKAKHLVDRSWSRDGQLFVQYKDGSKEKIAFTEYSKWLSFPCTFTDTKEERVFDLDETYETTPSASDRHSKESHECEETNETDLYFEEPDAEASSCTRKHTDEELENRREQHKLRRSIKIYGLSPDILDSNDETTLNMVIDILNQQLELTITLSDIKTVERVGLFQLGQSRPVVVKLVDSQTKKSVMRQKEYIERANANVTICEELTKLNSDVLSSVRRNAKHIVDRSWSRDGQLYAKYKDGTESKITFSEYSLWLSLPCKDERTREERENDSCQNKLSHSIRIHGMSPDEKNEKSEDTLNMIITFLNQHLRFPITREHIETAQRCGSFRFRKTRPLVVTFVKLKTKKTVMKHKEKIRRSNTGVTIYEELTKLNNDVLSSLRLKAKHLVDRSWSEDGHLYVQYKDGCKGEIPFSEYSKWLNLPLPTENK